MIEEFLCASDSSVFHISSFSSLATEVHLKQVTNEDILLCVDSVFSFSLNRYDPS